MKRDLILTEPLTSSFLSCEKDTELILRKLFIECRPYSDLLKSLLIIQSPDCLENLNKYKAELDSWSIAKMIEKEYIVLTPRIRREEHEQLKTCLNLSFDEFTPNATNPKFRDCMVHFDIICHHDSWNLQNFQLRPYKILGYIDGILNTNRLSGIGTLNFFGCKHNILNEEWGYHSLSYLAIHGSDDKIETQ